VRGCNVSITDKKVFFICLNALRWHDIHTNSQDDLFTYLSIIIDLPQQFERL
jgi:hypothetical protein